MPIVPADTLTKSELGRLLPGVPLRAPQETGSTSSDAKEWAAAGAAHGSLVITGRQSAGRGRRGRPFASPPGGIYMSVVLRPGPGSDAGLLTAAAAVAVCRAATALCGVALAIKWVNDLIYNRKKCCGILAEATLGPDGAPKALVVGIGINYTTPLDAFSQELRPIVTSLYPGGGAPVSAGRLAAAVYTQLLELAQSPAEAFLEEYRARSLALGRTLTVLADPPYTAKGLAIDEQARLVVQTQDGERRALAAGEISIRL